MDKPSFDDIYMNLALSLAKRSHCVKMKVGAVIAKETRIVSVGYNGPPAGTHNCNEEWPESGCPRSSKGSCSLAVHAEENAILYAAKNKVDLEGAVVYVTLSPCLPCARMMFTSGIKKVYYHQSYAKYKGLENEEGLDFLSRFGVEVLKHETIEQEQ
jgi:dCMP deaminase